MKINRIILLSACLLFATGNANAQKSKFKASKIEVSEKTYQDGTRTTDLAGTKFVNNRTDNDLVAAYGTCYLNDFRFFTMLHQDSWDLLRWESMGNAVLAHRTWRNWPYEQRLNVQVDGTNIPSASFRIEEVEQQFDFRQVIVSSPLVKIKRLDLMVSPRYWVTALQVINLQKKSAKITVGFDWNEKNKAELNIRPWTDNESSGFIYSIPDGPPVLVSTGAKGSWAKQGGNVINNKWELTMNPGETKTLDVDVYMGWADLPVYKNEGPGINATDEQAIKDRHTDREKFCQLSINKSIPLTNRWEDLMQICEARRHYLYERMPRLTGVEPQWDGMWCYAFDLIRSGINPPQGNFKDVWKVESLDVYREPFYWDGPASVHTFCNWDADLAARTLLTFLTSTKENGELCVSANPYRSWPNPTPQLANITMALWDCYQITQDKNILVSCYPLLVKHVRWLETKRNNSPNGPLMDVGYNIDYGPEEFYSTPTIWPDVQFFLVDRYQRLAKIADLIGRPKEEVLEWSNRATKLKEAIRKYMWDEKNGTFWCLTDKLEYKKIASPIEFHGMVAGVPTREQAERLLHRLNDTTKYAPSAKYPYGLPSAPFDSPYFTVADSWSGTIWPIQTYYTVRGLVNYGFQTDAAALSRNMYAMMARDYKKSGSIWEQYDPMTGNNLSNGFKGSGTPEVGRGYFTSGITTSVIDLLLKGCYGFERTDNPNAFYLTPAQLTGSWQGIENLQLSGNVRLAIQMKEEGEKYSLKIKFNGISPDKKIVTIQQVTMQDDSRKILRQIKLNDLNELKLSLKKSQGIRYLWTIE